MKRLTTLFLLLSATTLSAASPPRAPMPAGRLGLALRKLSVVTSALYIAAHPDDENTAMLAWLSDERLARTAYLSITRGDGGQNLIGPEKGETLGLLRTQELMAARRLDGAEQFFTRAIDFGYSKNPEETFAIWGKEQILADVVWVIRKFRPDVLITRFPTNPVEWTHGQHTASAFLAAEAFEAAGDPSRFPEQLRFVQPWKPKRLLHNNWRPQLENRPASAPKLITADLGTYNELLGKSYTEIAADSRSMHKSQGFGSAERRGSIVNYLEHLAGEPPGSDLFDGIDTSWNRIPGSANVGRLLAEASAHYKPEGPAAILPILLEAHREMDKLPPGPLVAAKQRELLEVIRSAAGLWIEAIAAVPTATAGSETKITATIVKRSDFPLRLETVGLLYGNPSQSVHLDLQNNQPAKVEVPVKLPPDLPTSNPYWLDLPSNKGTFSVADPKLAGLPEGAPVLPVVVTITSGQDTLFFDAPAVFRSTDPVRGEVYRDFEIVPAVTLDLDEDVYLFPDSKPKRVTVTAEGHGGEERSGTLELLAPEGWKVVPGSVPLSLKGKAPYHASFTVTPPAGASVGKLRAAAVIGSFRFDRSRVTIDYEHIPRQLLFPLAEAKLVRGDIRTTAGKIGYIAGSGDDVPEALAQLGYPVSVLSDEDLDRGDLQRYSAIVTGVRAYNTREALGRNQSRLMDYVREGGRLVVQYNTRGELGVASPAPYPLKISSDRVTVEEAPVELLEPGHKLLSFPNKITAADFEGWVQERGLYFPSEWDAQFTPLLSMHDPGEPERKGSLLVAPYGKGTFVYTGLSFFRQLPAGVPGAYRLFANLVSRP